MHIYEIYCNLLTGISYSDATPGLSFAYDHLGNLTQITDAAGTRTFAYNPYGELETDNLAANGLAWQVSELHEANGTQVDRLLWERIPCQMALFFKGEM